jgi:hypothetical protein
MFQLLLFPAPALAPFPSRFQWPFLQTVHIGALQIACIS